MTCSKRTPACAPLLDTAAEMAEQYCLNWNNFHTTFSSGMSEYLESGELTDVTLVVEGFSIQAHRLVLSLCSPYFKNLFQGTKSYHVPYVVLRDVKHSEMRDILNFIYKGEVNLRHDQLLGFLRTAEMLQIKGLSQNDTQGAESTSSLENNETSDTNQQTPEKVTSSALAAAMRGSSPEDKTIGSHSPLASSSTGKASPNTALSEKSAKTCNTLHFMTKRMKTDIENPASPPDYQSEHDVARLEDDGPMHMKEENSLIYPEEWNCKQGGVQCSQCHRLFANRYNLKVHVRDKHDTKEGTLQCTICQKRMRNPSCLRVHMYHHRKQAAECLRLSQAVTDTPSRESTEITQPSSP